MSKQFTTQVKKETLAEQVAASVRAAILAGDWQPGESLPTEPEMGEQFGVSRQVIRDAVRLLMAQGLVEVRHGSGMYVTQSQQGAFGDALLLALQRANATVWDVEEVEQILWPAVTALAAERRTQAELDQIESALTAYLDTFRRLTEEAEPSDEAAAGAARRELMGRFSALTEGVFAATHNTLLTLLAPSLTQLHSPRSWSGDADRPTSEIVEREGRFLRRWIDTIRAGDPQQARQVATDLFSLPTEAIDAMRDTPVGEVPKIPLSLDK